MIKRTVTHVLLGGALGLAGCNMNKPEPAPVAAPPAKTPAPPAPAAPTASTIPSLSIPHVGSCEPTAELSDLLSRMVQTTDANGDGEIQKSEAYSAADFLIGGFFFRADTNGDGTIQPDEGRAARAELMKQQPAVAALLARTATPQGRSALTHMAELLGIDYGKPVTSVEMRDAGHQLVDELFRIADTDKSNSLTQAEAQQAAWNSVHDLGKDAFASTDRNHDSKLTLDELRAALDEPTRLAFQAADLDHNGALTEAEAASAMRSMMRSLWLPSYQTSRSSVTN